MGGNMARWSYYRRDSPGPDEVQPDKGGGSIRKRPTHLRMKTEYKNKHAQVLGKKGGKSGRGAAKARTTEQARAAAQARWAKRQPKSKKGKTR